MVGVFSRPPWAPPELTLAPAPTPQDSLADLVLRLQLARREKRGLELREAALRAQGPAHLLLLQQLRWEQAHLAGAGGSSRGSSEDPSSEEEEEDQEEEPQQRQVPRPASCPKNKWWSRPLLRPPAESPGVRVF